MTSSACALFGSLASTSSIVLCASAALPSPYRIAAMRIFAWAKPPCLAGIFSSSGSASPARRVEV